MAEYKGKEKRDRTPKGALRRLQEKTIWNCLICYPRLCSCKNRNEHGVLYLEKS